MDIVAIQLRQFVYLAGGWFGTETGDTNATNALSPPIDTPGADSADAADVAAPMVQITTDFGLTWATIAATENYVSIIQPQVQANRIGLIATPILFEFKAQSGINGIHLAGYGGGRSDMAGGRDEQGCAAAAEFAVGLLASIPESGMAGIPGIALAVIGPARWQKPLGMARPKRSRPSG